MSSESSAPLAESDQKGIGALRRQKLLGILEELRSDWPLSEGLIPYVEHHASDAAVEKLLATLLDAADTV